MDKFWIWKKADIVFRMTRLQYSWDEFLMAYADVHDKTNEIPETESLMKDYEYWKTYNPPLAKGLPSEDSFFTYYEERVAPQRKKLNLST